SRDRGDEDRVEGSRRDQAAQEAGMSGAEYSRAKKVLSQGSKSLIEAMDEDLVPTRLAAKIADLPRGQHNEIVKRIKEGSNVTAAYEAATGGAQGGDAWEGDEPAEQGSDHDRDPLGRAVPPWLRDVFQSGVMGDTARGCEMFAKLLRGVAAWNPHLAVGDIE